MDGELTTTTTNQTTFNVNVYFVVPKNYEDERQCDEKMQEAFKVSYYFGFFLHSSISISDKENYF